MSILDSIVEEKRREIARLPQRLLAAGDLRDALLERDERRDFLAALQQNSEPPHVGSCEPAVGDDVRSLSKTPGLKEQPEPPSVGSYRPRVALIAEVKKASPSAGVICKDFDPVRIAREYEAAGAHCLSVLTDEKFFQGSLECLRQIRAAVKLPLLRKDFIIDERQILEAIEWGADAILLIVAILDDVQLRRFHALANEAGLAALVEVHDETEVDRALACGARLIGVNNRDLKTFKVDLGTTERLAARLVEGRGSRVEGRSAAASLAPAPLLVAESGIHNRADVERLARCGANAILVGESLVREGNIRRKIRELIGP